MLDEQGVIVATPEKMNRVDIAQGWLLDQFAYHVLGLDPEEEAYQTQLWLGELNTEFAQALTKYDALVDQKNKQYGDAWQKDGPVTSLVDLKDKLYRLQSASDSGAVLTWDVDKLRGTLYDILVRSIMILSWFELNFDDDDDERSDE
jgi:hypothetical protein